MSDALSLEKFWVDKSKYANAERQFNENAQEERRNQVKIAFHKKKAEEKSPLKATSNGGNNDAGILQHSSEDVNNKHKSKNAKKKNKYFRKAQKGTASNQQCTLVSEIAKAREHIKNSLEKMDGIATLAASPVSSDILERVAAVEKKNIELKKLVEKLNALYIDSQKRISALESKLNTNIVAEPVAAAIADNVKSDDDDGVDLFASDNEEENEEATRVREECLAAYAAKKSKKPVLIAKSSLVLDVKPWDDETDLKQMEALIREIKSDGLLWGASKFVPVAFGIQKLSISCVVEDEKVSIDWLTEEIEKFEDYVQSVDIAAFNKI